MLMNQLIEYSIEFDSIKISESEIVNKIGYVSTEVPAIVSHQIQNIKDEIGTYCEIKGGFKLFDKINVLKNSISINDLNFKTDKIISGSLRNADSIAIFVCTAGEKLSNWSKLLFEKDDPLKAYIVDLTSSIIVEKAMDQLEIFIEESVNDQKHISNRYSPGYCGWNVSEQHQLFSLLADNFCGVSLNEAALMNPIKSVSGIIGIGKDIKKLAYQCNKYDKLDCLLAEKH